MVTCKRRPRTLIWRAAEEKRNKNKTKFHQSWSRHGARLTCVHCKISRPTTATVRTRSNQEHLARFVEHFAFETRSLVQYKIIHPSRVIKSNHKEGQLDCQIIHPPHLSNFFVWLSFSQTFTIFLSTFTSFLSTFTSCLPTFPSLLTKQSVKQRHPLPFVLFLCKSYKTDQKPYNLFYLKHLPSWPPPQTLSGLPKICLKGKPYKRPPRKRSRHQHLTRSR